MLAEARGLFELNSSLLLTPLLLRAPRGDGHPVLALPGFLASDISMAPMRRYLKELGYDAHAWNMGRNLGGIAAKRGALRDLVRRIHESTGRKVSLVGWSLGGIYARETAKRVADSVRCVITLGAPFAGHPRATNAWRLYEFLSGDRVDGARDWDQVKRAPPVPTTSIYSRTDGIVAWQCSVEQPGPQAENIEVEASHVGLVVNPAVLYAIADRLAQPEGRWRPFARTGLRRLIYRDPATADYFPDSRFV
jgi:pimeloyl-ACP methyl ester carboxylesterase